MRKRWRLSQTEGQSLVEMTITLPLLLLMFVGLIEVGAALRSYLVVVNANREGTRMAARGQWFDSDEEMSYIADRVIAAAGIESIGGEYVPFMRTESSDGLPANTTIAVHYVKVPDQINLGVPDYEGYEIGSSRMFGPHQTSRVDLDAVGEEAAQANLSFNQEYFAGEGGILDIPSEDNFVIVEVWYEHEQWLKMPIFTAVLPETFTLYAQTRMRVTLDSRIH
jgi:hypothetical protein